jgi:hypothetical protein
MSYKKKISHLATKLGDEGVSQLADVLDKEAEKADEPWKKTLLDLLAESTRRHGPEGFALAQNAVEGYLDKNNATDIRRVSKNLLTASNLLAQMQNAEAEEKERLRKWLRALVQTLGKIVQVVLGAVL